METQQIQQLTTTFEGHLVADHFADVGKMVERRLSSDQKKSLKNPDTLDSP